MECVYVRVWFAINVVLLGQILLLMSSFDSVRSYSWSVRFTTSSDLTPDKFVWVRQILILIGSFDSVRSYSWSVRLTTASDLTPDTFVWVCQILLLISSFESVRSYSWSDRLTPSNLTPDLIIWLRQILRLISSFDSVRSYSWSDRLINCPCRMILLQFPARDGRPYMRRYLVTLLLHVTEGRARDVVGNAAHASSLD